MIKKMVALAFPPLVGAEHRSRRRNSSWCSSSARRDAHTSPTEARSAGNPR